MKFKIDENLPIELADLLQNEGYDASTIYSESLKGAKDTTVIFGDRPPETYSGDRLLTDELFPDLVVTAEQIFKKAGI